APHDELHLSILAPAVSFLLLGLIPCPLPSATLFPYTTLFRSHMIVFASKSDHCLLELLWRHERGELNVEIPMVISNHRDVEEEVGFFGIPFHHVPAKGP